MVIDLLAFLTYSFSEFGSPDDKAKFWDFDTHLWRQHRWRRFFSPVENAYWRGFSRVCVDYNTAIGGNKRVVFSKETIEVPGNFATFENLLWRFSDDC